MLAAFNRKLRINKPKILHLVKPRTITIIKRLIAEHRGYIPHLTIFNFFTGDCERPDFTLNSRDVTFGLRSIAIRPPTSCEQAPATFMETVLAGAKVKSLSASRGNLPLPSPKAQM